MLGIEVALSAGYVLMVYKKDQHAEAHLSPPASEEPSIQREGMNTREALAHINQWCLNKLLNVGVASEMPPLELLLDLDTWLAQGNLICHKHNDRFQASLSGVQSVDIPLNLFDEVEQDGETRFWTDDRGVLFAVAREKGKTLASVVGKAEGISDPWEKEMQYRCSGASLLEALQNVCRKTRETPLVS